MFKNRLLGGWGGSFCRGVFVSLEAARADFCAYARIQKRPLEIGIAAALAGRVELGRTSAVAVAAALDRAFSAGCTDFSHNVRPMLPYSPYYART